MSLSMTLLIPPCVDRQQDAGEFAAAGPAKTQGGERDLLGSRISHRIIGSGGADAI